MCIRDRIKSLFNHAMQPNLVRKLKMLLVICLITSFAGVIYQLINEQHLDQSSVVFGLPLGLIFGFLELFLFAKAERRFRRWSFTKMFVFKTLFYTALIYLSLIHISEPTRLLSISYAVFCLKKKK